MNQYCSSQCERISDDLPQNSQSRWGYVSEVVGRQFISVCSFKKIPFADTADNEWLAEQIGQVYAAYKARVEAYIK